MPILAGQIEGERLGHGRQAAYSQHCGVQIHSVDLSKTTHIADDNAAHRVRYAYARKEHVRFFGLDAECVRGLVHNVDVGRVEAQTGEKIRQGKVHEDGIYE